MKQEKFEIEDVVSFPAVVAVRASAGATRPTWVFHVSKSTRRVLSNEVYGSGRAPRGMRRFVEEWAASENFYKFWGQEP